MTNILKARSDVVARFGESEVEFLSIERWDIQSLDLEGLSLVTILERRVGANWSSILACRVKRSKHEVILRLCHVCELSTMPDHPC
jgi:hypothetical protein